MDLGWAKIDFGGVIREACMEYVPEAEIGDYTLIHVGFALNLDQRAGSLRDFGSIAPDK